MMFNATIIHDKFMIVPLYLYSLLFLLKFNREIFTNELNLCK